MNPEILTREETRKLPTITNHDAHEVGRQMGTVFMNMITEGLLGEPMDPKEALADQIKVFHYSIFQNYRVNVWKRSGIYSEFGRRLLARGMPKKQAKQYQAAMREVAEKWNW